MTNQIKTGASRQAFWWPTFNGSLRAFSILLLSAIFLEIQSSGRAQENLVDLYDWSNETQNISPGSQGNYMDVYSANWVDFFGGFDTNQHAASPVLAGNLETTPGASYEISFTMANDPIDPGSACLSFGSFTTNIVLPRINNGTGFSGPPINIDFTAVATSATTTMSFQSYLYYDGEESLNNLEVMEVPEASNTRLFCYGGCIFLLAKQLRKLIQKRDFAFRRIP